VELEEVLALLDARIAKPNHSAANTNTATESVKQVTDTQGATANNDAHFPRRYSLPLGVSDTDIMSVTNTA